MRNASKNTIKRVMRKALFDRKHKGLFYDIGNELAHNFYKRYHLFNEIGAQIYRMSKGKICNRELVGVGKYTKYELDRATATIKFGEELKIREI